MFFHVQYEPWSSSKHYLEDLLENLLGILTSELDLFKYNVYMHESVAFRPYQHGNVVLVSTLESLSSLYEPLRARRTGNLSYTIIYIMALHDPDDRDLHRMLSFFWAISLVNVAIIVELPDSEVVMVSYLPFSDEGCEMTRPVVINRYDRLRRRWMQRPHFPRKLNNFHRCNITCNEWLDDIYLTERRDEAGRIVGYQGIEWELIAFIAESLNATADVNVISEEQSYDVMNSTGWFLNEILKTAHYSVGSPYYEVDPDEIPIFSRTAYFHLTSVNFAANILNTLSSYEKLTFPFEPLVWIIIVLSVGFSCLVIFASGFFRMEQKHFLIGQSNHLPYYNLVSAFLGVTITDTLLPSRNFARFLLMLWLLATMILRCAYQSGMYHLLWTNLHRQPPQTVEDLINMDYELVMNRAYEPVLYIWPTLQERVQMMDEQEFVSLEALFKETTRRKAVLLSSEYLDYYRQQHRGVDLHMVPERILAQHFVFYVRHNSYMVPVLNELISRAHNNGFKSKWIRMYLGDQTNAVISTESDVAPLTLGVLQSVFMLFIWSQLITIGVFIVELVCGKWSWICDQYRGYESNQLKPTTESEN